MRATTPLIVGISLLSALAIMTGELYGQEGSASLEITVRTDEGDQPLSGARVVVDGLDVRGMTDRYGFLRLPNLPAGSLHLSVTHLGYAPMEDVVEFEAGEPKRLLVRMGIKPIVLDGVSVRTSGSTLASRGFYDRQKSGVGTFITRAEITAMNVRYMSDVLRRTSGFQIGTAPFGARPPASIRGNGTRCPIQYFVDGALTSGFNIDEVMARDVEGIEIYRGASTIPPAYNRGTAPCGVILIWTRVE